MRARSLEVPVLRYFFVLRGAFVCPAATNFEHF